MAINYGVGCIERELVKFQPPVPPPPPVGEEYFVIKETPSIDHVRRATLVKRRNTIVNTSGEDDDDDNIDSLVDLKLFQFKQASAPENSNSPELPTPLELEPERSDKSPIESPRSPREFDGKLKPLPGWIRSTEPRPARKVSFLGGEGFKPERKL